MVSVFLTCVSTTSGPEEMKKSIYLRYTLENGGI